MEESNKLSYEEWYALFEDEINIELAEIGATRELEFELRYEKYLDI